MRVCVLANSTPGSWIDHYIRAFRAVGETIVVGAPAPRRKLVEPAEEGENGDDAPLDDVAPLLDIPCDFANCPPLRELLGSRWPVDLLVGIADTKGRTLHPDIPGCGCPSAFITATAWSHPRDFIEARQYDFVFSAQQDWVPLFRATGSRQAFWLPLACAPEAHFPVALQPRYDISFAGRVKGPFYEKRRALLDMLTAEFNVRERNRVTGAKYSRAYSRGRLGFNHSVMGELNARVFEVMAMGRPLLTNAGIPDNGIEEIFDDRKDLILYRNVDELMRLARHYLERDEEREAIAEAGREKVLGAHTYRHRVRELLYMIKSYAPDPDFLPGPRLIVKIFEGPELENYFSSSPGTVVDLGLNITSSKFLLRRRAVNKLIGLTHDAVLATQKAAQYDVMASWPGGNLRDIDTVLIAADTQTRPLSEALNLAHGILEPGGTIIVRLGAKDRETIEHGGGLPVWLREHQFALRKLGPELADGRQVIVARKFTNSVSNVMEHLYSRLNLPPEQRAELLASVPEE